MDGSGVMGVEATTGRVHEDSTVGVCLQREPDAQGTCSAPEAHRWHLFCGIALTPCFTPQAPKPSSFAELPCPAAQTTSRPCSSIGRPCEHSEFWRSQRNKAMFKIIASSSGSSPWSAMNISSARSKSSFFVLRIAASQSSLLIFGFAFLSSER